MSTPTARFDLRPVARSVTAARHMLSELLTAWGVPHDVEDAALLLAELVADVIDHVGGESTLCVEVTLPDRWGAEHHRGGKRVWLELAAPQV
jgi:hypothetical protein